MTLSLQEILIVGSACEQAKFSELTMDMFRMLQTLEREPTESTTNPLSMVGQKSRIGISFYCKQSLGISSRPIDILVVIMHIIHINNGSTSG